VLVQWQTENFFCGPGPGTAHRQEGDTEGSGLPPEFAGLGQAVRIPHSDRIDSLNLSVAVAIGAYAFTRPHVGLNCDERKELI